MGRVLRVGCGGTGKVVDVEVGRKKEKEKSGEQTRTSINLFLHIPVQCRCRSPAQFQYITVILYESSSFSHLIHPTNPSPLELPFQSPWRVRWASKRVRNVSVVDLARGRGGWFSLNTQYCMPRCHNVISSRSLPVNIFIQLDRVTWSRKQKDVKERAGFYVSNTTILT